MNKKTIVTLADSNYFSLLEELIHSIKKLYNISNSKYIVWRSK